MSEKHEAAEVALKLVVDSNAEEATSRIRAGLSGIWDKSKGLGKAAGAGLAQGTKLAAGLAASGVGLMVAAASSGIVAMGGLAAESAHAFMESEEQVRGLASTLSMIDQNGNSFERLHEGAEGLKDELEEIAMQAGLTDDAMVAVFTDVIERGGKSVEAAEKLADEMAYAGRAIPGGAESLSQGFEMLEMGMIRAKNPLVQLIASTGTLKGSAKSVAKEMQKMGIAEQMKLAEKAVASMSAKMKQAPMTIAQMKTSIGVGIGNLFEEAGKPIVEAMTPAVAKLQSLFTNGRGGLTGAAREFGELMAKGVSIVLPTVEAVEQAVKANWTEIRSSAGGLYGQLKNVFDYLYKNKEAIAKTFVDVAGVIAKVAGYFLKVIETTWSKTRDLVKYAAKTGMLGDDAKGFLKDETRTAASEELRGKVQGRSNTGAIDDSYKQELHDKFVADMRDSGATIAEAEEYYGQAMRRAEQDHQATFTAIGKYKQAALFADADSFAKAWQIANKSNDEGAKEYVANFLASNQTMVKALAETGPEMLGDGFGALMDKLDGMHSTIADDIRKGRKLNLGDVGKVQISQQFGAVTIHQDLRDQDPDRVAVVFRRDLAKYGSNRLGSGMASALGNF